MRTFFLLTLRERVFVHSDLMEGKIVMNRQVALASRMTKIVFIADQANRVLPVDNHLTIVVQESDLIDQRPRVFATDFAFSQAINQILIDDIAVLVWVGPSLMHHHFHHLEFLARFGSDLGLTLLVCYLSLTMLRMARLLLFEVGEAVISHLHGRTIFATAFTAQATILVIIIIVI